MERTVKEVLPALVSNRDKMGESSHHKAFNEMSRNFPKGSFALECLNKFLSVKVLLGAINQERGASIFWGLHCTELNFVKISRNFVDIFIQKNYKCIII